jgi:hypothetical protein
MTYVNILESRVAEETCRNIPYDENIIHSREGLQLLRKYTLK